LGTLINGSTQIDSKNINQHWGCNQAQKR
jgi:hypothetical protein